ncbi:Sec-independent protein translocase subunit TatA [Phycicoccus sp. Root563]|uniref:Sec-independent protein translocase subunit TatA n=1 Tax=Phycicoccus sp. Root563 TaxID=1736562 RepID=UPI0009E82A37|nr:Sec-independent protein translocase subunit TatA [Phycicoccus sp. Root563]
MGRGLFEGWHIIVLLVLLVVLFGFKRLPDAARSIGRSMRIFKSEVHEMKNDGKSAASSDTVKGEAVADPQGPGATAPGRTQAAPGATTAASPITEDNSPRTDNATGL